MIRVKEDFTWLLIDDVIQCLYNITDNGYSSIFEEPTFKYYKHLRDEFGVVIELALFNCTGYNVVNQTALDDLSRVTDAFKTEFQANSDWLKFSFHSWASNVRYLNGATGNDGSFDYSRNLYSDYTVVKNQVIRFAGASSWYVNTVPHYYDARKSEIDQLATSEGLNILVGYSFQNRNRGVCNYLTLSQQRELNETGYVYDGSNGVLHVLRDFAFERVNGNLKVPGTPDRVIDFLEYYNHESKGFMNPENHEVQIINGPSDEWPVKRDLLDFCSWANQRGYKWKFPDISDFEI